jgi:hypothetical protein
MATPVCRYMTCPILPLLYGEGWAEGQTYLTSSVCILFMDFVKRTCKNAFFLGQFVKFSPTLDVIELEFFSYLKVDEMLVSVKCHTLRFYVNQCRDHFS